MTVRLSAAELARLGARPRETRAKPRRPPRREEGAGGFLTQLLLAGLAKPRVEYRFHSVRRWRFDWAWPDQMVAAEREGGSWVGGRHVRSKGYADDCLKYSEAAILGWRVIRFTVDMERTGVALDLIVRAIGSSSQIKTSDVEEA